jgi:hypothetical protein
VLVEQVGHRQMVLLVETLLSRMFLAELLLVRLQQKAARLVGIMLCKPLVLLEL